MPPSGRDRESGPRFTPSGAAGQGDGAPVNQRAPRPGQGDGGQSGGGQSGRGSGSAGPDRRGGAVPEQFAARVRPSGGSGPSDREIVSGHPAKGIGGLQPGGLLGLIGTLRTPAAMLVVAGAALIGIVASLAAGQEPGILLGFFIIVGSLAAVLGIQRGSVYLVFPMPAVTFFVAAIAIGKVHDAKLASSTAGLGAGFLQWVAGIFDPAVAATVLVVLVGGARWLLGRQLITGTSRLVTSRPAAPPARPGRPATGSWDDDNPFEDPAPAGRSPRTGPSPHQGSRPQPQFDGVPNGTRPPRPPREQRGAPDQRTGREQRPDPGRDQWGEPGRPTDRGRSVPPGSSRPPQPPGRPAQPRDRTGPRPQPPNSQPPNSQPPNSQPPGPSWSPNNQRPSRPPRPQPPDGWTR